MRTNAHATLEAEISPVWLRIRAALADVLAGLPNAAGLRRAADLERELGIARTLAWQFFTIATSSDGLIGSTKMPGAAATRRFLRAAAGRGVPKERIQAAADAIKDFDRLAKSHAGDRASFRSMVAATATDGAESIELQHRRATFRGNAHLWGVQADAALWAGLYHPGQRPGTIDILSVGGTRGLRRVRPEAPFTLCKPRTVTDRSGALNTLFLNPGGGAVSPLLEQFSTPGLADRAVIHEVADGWIELLLPHGHVGIPGAVDYTTAALVQNVDWRSERGNDKAFHSFVSQSPVEVVIHDVLIYDGLFSPFNVFAGVYGSSQIPDAGSRPGRDWTESHRLPVRTEVSHLGRGSACVACREIARYPELIRDVCGRVGWNPENFDVYRCRVMYPILHAAQIIRIEPA